MKGFQEKRRFKKILYSNFSIVILVAIILFLGKSAWSSWQKYSQTKESKDQAEERLDDLSNQKDLLEKRSNQIDSERGREEFLRERFDIAKEGEELINVVDITE